MVINTRRYISLLVALSIIYYTSKINTIITIRFIMKKAYYYITSATILRHYFTNMFGTHCHYYHGLVNGIIGHYYCNFTPHVNTYYYYY